MRTFLVTGLTVLSVFTLSACGGGGSSDAAPAPTLPTPTTPVADTTAPVVTLVGNATIDHEQGQMFTDPGATANDNIDGTVSVVVTGQVQTSAGSYTLTYTASDAAGNSANVERIVNVADTSAPIITLTGESTLSLIQGSDYTELGANAIDSVDGNISVSINGSVNTAVAGMYTITYSVSDAAGNQSSTTRQVTVQAEQSATQLDVINGGSSAQRWDGGLNAFDAATNFSECNNDGGAACPSISWATVSDTQRGDVLQITHSAAGDLAGFFVKTATPVDLTSFSNGALLFDIKTIAGDGQYTMKLDCVFPCTSGDQTITMTVGQDWTPIIVPLSALAASDLNLSRVDTGIVIWASAHNSNVFQLDNVRFVDQYSGNSSIEVREPNAPPPVTYNISNVGAGSISDTINPASYKCVFDFGNWIYNAGIVRPGIAGCDTATSTPVGEPTPLFPQVTGDAQSLPVASHRWWGSVSFMGEMTIGDANSAGYITPDPITARVSNAGIRMMGIPNGLNVFGIDFGYRIPDPFAEVFDGIAIANSMHSDMQAYAAKTSDGSVTVEWQSNNAPVMQATFVHGSPYVFVDVLDGDLVIKTLRENGGEKGIFHESDNSLGVWTSVAGNTNYFLVVGDDGSSFSNITSKQIGASSPTKSFTIALMPSNAPNADMISSFSEHARNKISEVRVDYAVDTSTNAVQITHQYLDDAGQAVTTMSGMQPLHWKNRVGNQTNSGYQIRSARGITKFAAQSSFTYEIPHVGVLPSLPTFTDSLDIAQVSAYIDEFVNQPTEQWTTRQDTYWLGKDYGKVAELIAISDALGLSAQKTTLMNWLKAELEDWFTAETDGELDDNKYFVYDETWNTLLGMEESFSSHQQLNDHHFHYGYFVRAAAEICRHEATWCADDNYGAMVKMLIRDYAGERDDPMFPYLRHFDPANGFSWASGNVNFVRGNNNESTSEAANAYGAMVLFGLITNDQDMVDRGLYLHASTAASFWEYWNNIDGYAEANGDNNNFPAGYNNITTSIIWGDGAVFSTWFSAAFAHILGIQGLPTNTLNLHIGLHSEYLEDYVQIGLSEASNNKPSGLVADQWRDIWWSIWAMTDANASISDYNSVNSYLPEAGSTKAHTYHWLHTFKELGQLAMGTGELTANHPAAVAFVNGNVSSYVVYNYSDTAITVTFSDGTIVNAIAQDFTIVQTTNAQ